jgi:hypothetical protein
MSELLATTVSSRVVAPLACVVGLCFIISCQSAPRQAPVQTEDPRDVAVRRIVSMARHKERDLYLALAERERTKQRPGGLWNTDPFIESGPSTLSPAERRQAALKRDAERWQAMCEASAKKLEKLAVDVMIDGPYGEFGGPTSAEIWLDVRFGRPSNVERSRIENYRPRSLVAAQGPVQPLPPLREDPPRTIFFSTPNGTGSVYRVSDNYYIVSPPR